MGRGFITIELECGSGMGNCSICLCGALQLPMSMGIKDCEFSKYT